MAWEMSESTLDNEDKLVTLDIIFGLALGNGERKLDRGITEIFCKPCAFERLVNIAELVEELAT